MFNLLMTTLIFGNEQSAAELDSEEEQEYYDEIDLIESELSETQQHVAELYDKIQDLEERLEKFENF